MCKSNSGYFSFRCIRIDNIVLKLKFGFKKILLVFVFYITVGILKILSLLPLAFLYVFSDLLFITLFYIICYRRNVVKQNLSQSFKHLKEDEINRIVKNYYKHLSDLIIENIWAISARRESIQKHCRFKNIEVLDQYYDHNKDVIVIMGHLGNWEWSGLSMSCTGKHQLRALYRPIKNKYFDKFFLKFRSRLGGEMIPMNQVLRYMIHRSSKPVCTTFIADQTPSPENAVWIHFLNQETPFFKGYAVISQKYNLPVVMATVNKIRRGYYEIYLQELSSQGDDLVVEFANKLEKEIIKNPSYWLWSHKRWKHQKPVIV